MYWKTKLTYKAGSIIQFDWSRNWKRKVEPHLGLDLVQRSLIMGMKLFDEGWKWEDGPHAIGSGRWNGQRVTEGKLSWYQPWGRCHWIGFFACAIGVLNYPELDWEFVSGHCHTVPVGSLAGQRRVVMDILHFKTMTAAESIAHATLAPPGSPEPAPGWAKLFTYYVENVEIGRAHV